MGVLTKIYSGIAGWSNSKANCPNGPTSGEFFNAKTQLISASPHVLIFEANVLILIDRSSSMPKAALRHICGKGISEIVQTLRRSEVENGFRYNLCIMVFSTDLEILLPFTPLDEIPKGFKLKPIDPQGVTCTGKAITAAFREIDTVKARQDEARVPRQGSILVTITDGRPTGEDGREVPLSPDIVREIANRSATRKTSTVAFGFGNINDSTLTQLAPATLVEYSKGRVYESRHAVRCDDFKKGQDEEGQFEILFKLVAKASSSSGCIPFGGSGANIEPVFVAEGDASVPPDLVEAVELPTGYVVVS